ncbi:MAG: molybdate ABC transporter substrate-binding protein [Polaromonas sp.]|nr:molybdate ABC transporter substrate-binding protein [Polaromonas sp.]
MRSLALRWLLSLLMLAGSAAALADEVQVAVAANFAVPMKQIAEYFEKETGHKALLSVGATGKFYAQITNGAPFDVFLSADDETPAKLEKQGFAVAGSRFTYATGRLVLWSAKPDFVDAKAAVLLRGDFKHLAIAAPKLAPYGAAAMETLEKIGLLGMLQPKIVQGESIGQTFSMISTSNAELGFIALSQVYADNASGGFKSGSGWVVPANLHSPLLQDAVLLTRAKAKPAAAQLMTFLKSEQARAVIRSFGYEP